jgi:hypothetical protein
MMSHEVVKLSEYLVDSDSESVATLLPFWVPVKGTWSLIIGHIFVDGHISSISISTTDYAKMTLN